MQTALTRREWLALAACWAEAVRAQSTSGAFRYLDATSAGEVESIAAQIIPSDDTPGAREAGVIWFIDGALATFAEDKRAVYRSGLAAAAAKRAEMFPGSVSLATLPLADQLRVVQAIENTEFFETVRLHTILGFFSHPKYGGNRNQSGWKLIGFEHAMMFQPPFGHYDAEAAQGGPK